MRRFSFRDQFCIQANHALSTIFTVSDNPRKNPADSIAEENLTRDEIKNSLGCMRVNHTGEVCAQALYRGQLLSSRSKKTKAMLEKSCDEETDHLAWTKKRIEELNGKTSILNLFFYNNAFFIGVLAGLCGDRWSLGFVEETEIQVAKHLESHLEKISEKDQKSRAIIAQMREEEIQHEQAAVTAGAAQLPWIIKKCMRLHAKMMTVTAYYC
ncbi:MAG: 2-polyprenyl-3-methyl-6-methoxy-1,4-benzoquinone monooxygenase [Coxiellaceae bacterium]|nr:2-polyprenyl-3-methyl-6-methoxy-1,4-benzoquinone monooxygenase [Coxiellaceae bacterium]